MHTLTTQQHTTCTQIPWNGFPRLDALRCCSVCAHGHAGSAASACCGQVAPGCADSPWSLLEALSDVGPSWKLCLMLPDAYQSCAGAADPGPDFTHVLHCIRALSGKESLHASSKWQGPDFTHLLLCMRALGGKALAQSTYFTAYEVWVARPQLTRVHHCLRALGGKALTQPSPSPHASSEWQGITAASCHMSCVSSLSLLSPAFSLS